MTDMQYYGLIMILSTGLLIVMLVLRGQSKFMWALGFVLVAMVVAVLAFTAIPAELASALMGTHSVKVVPGAQ